MRRGWLFAPTVSRPMPHDGSSGSTTGALRAPGLRLATFCGGGSRACKRDHTRIRRIALAIALAMATGMRARAQSGQAPVNPGSQGIPRGNDAQVTWVGCLMRVEKNPARPGTGDNTEEGKNESSRFVLKDALTSERAERPRNPRDRAQDVQGQPRRARRSSGRADRTVRRRADHGHVWRHIEGGCDRQHRRGTTGGRRESSEHDPRGDGGAHDECLVSAEVSASAAGRPVLRLAALLAPTCSRQPEPITGVDDRAIHQLHLERQALVRRSGR